MKKTAFLLASIIVLGILSSPSLAFRERPDRGPDGGPGRSFIKMKIMKDLDLTDKQKEAIKLKEQELERDSLPTRQALDNIREDIEKEMLKDKPDKDRIFKLIDSTSEKMTQMQKKRIEFILWINQQLNKEQIQKLHSNLEKREKIGFGRKKAW